LDNWPMHVFPVVAELLERQVRFSGKKQAHFNHVATPLFMEGRSVFMSYSSRAAAFGREQ
jgi:hypothetical protein